MTEPLDDERLGDLVLRENFLSEEELKVCMDARGESSPPRSLQEVMLEKDFLTPFQMKRILKKYFSGENSSESTVDRFGDVAIRKGFVTEEQLQECLEEQKAGRQSGRPLRLGQILMQRRLISTQQFLEVLKAQEAHSISCPECGKVAFSGEMESSHGEGFRCASCQAVLDQSEEPPPFPPPPSELPESDVVTIQKPSSLPLREEPTKDASGGGDRYRLIQQVGQNSRTVVHQAYDRSRGEVVLLKVVRKEHFDTPFAEKFLQAARKRKDYVHPAHLSVFDIGIRDGCPYFTMEYEEGRSLEKRIREGEFSPLDVARTMERIALALGSLHEKGSCHGNIKASNIFFSREEEVRFSDAGAQEDLSDYVSPERVGKPGADVPGDIYALGIVLYQMVTGKLPYVSVPRDMLQKSILSRVPRAPRDLNENIPVDLEAICLRAIEKDPLMRYESVRDLAGDLHRFLEGIPVRSRPGS
ncbi:MAG: serine/threonine-protein kinase, partial [Planctomycetota bacterium]|nr:serine/threonine-protein kinase [Planctomycetota bacterium]